MKKQLQITPIAEENMILRGHLREIYDIVGHGSTFSDDCPAEMLAGIVEEVAGEIEDKDSIIEENKILRGYLRKIDEIAGNDSVYIEDCTAETLAVIVDEAVSEMKCRDVTIKNQLTIINELRSLNMTLSDRVAELESDLAECRINLREADAKPPAPTDKYGLMLGRIGQMIPVEFYRTPESTVEQAVALLLDRYYSEMATSMYNQNQKLENQ